MHVGVERGGGNVIEIFRILTWLAGVLCVGRGQAANQGSALCHTTATVTYSEHDRFKFGTCSQSHNLIIRSDAGLFKGVREFVPQLG